MTGGETLVALGISLVFVGVFIIAIGAILISARKGKSNDKAETAGVVIIGPIPIIFGSDKKSLRIILTLSIVLTVLLLITTVVYYFLQT